MYANLSLVSTTKADDLPLVSTPLAVNFDTGTTGVVDPGGKVVMGTISDRLHLKVKLK
jgi:hypothetical protein